MLRTDRHFVYAKCRFDFCIGCHIILGEFVKPERIERKMKDVTDSSHT